MAHYNSTQALDLLGKTVSVVELCGSSTNQATGVVTAVVIALPGAPVGSSILVGSDFSAQYFDLDDSSLTVH